jgi:hypothetical protein
LPYALGVLALLLVAYGVTYSTLNDRSGDWTTVTYQCGSTATPPGSGGECLPAAATQTTRVVTAAPNDLGVPQSFLVTAGVLAAAAFTLLLLPVLSKVTIGPSSVSVELASTSKPSLPAPAG